MERRTGAWVFGYGLALLVVSVIVMVYSTTELWDTVSLVVGLLGGFGLGTGMAIMMIPADDADLSDFYDDPLRTPPQRWELPAQVLCLSCGEPGCTGEPCVNS